MTGFVMFIHALLCVILSAVILMQSGRGGGLTEGFAAAESLFGAKTNAFMIKATTVMSILFFVTCLSLAFLSAKKDESLMSKKIMAPMKPFEQTKPVTEPAASESAVEETSAAEAGAAQ